MSMQRVDRKAFTLIEVLVVIGIVLLLAAIVFPVMSRMKMSGYRSVAISNTRQILQAIEMYTVDHGGRIPFARNVKYGYWMEEIGLISGGKPTLRDPRFTFRAESKPLYDSLAGYAINACLRPSTTRLSDVNPSRTILVAPVSFWKVDLAPGNAWIPVVTLTTPDTLVFENGFPDYPGKTVEVQGPYGATRYFGAGIYGFVDGHVRSLKPDQIELMPNGDPCGTQGALENPNSDTGPTFVAWPS